MKMQKMQITFNFMMNFDYLDVGWSRNFPNFSIAKKDLFKWFEILKFNTKINFVTTKNFTFYWKIYFRVEKHSEISKIACSLVKCQTDGNLTVARLRSDCLKWNCHFHL